MNLDADPFGIKASDSLILDR